LIRTRTRRLALAVLAGLFMGLVGVTAASAETTASSAPATSSVQIINSGGLSALPNDWWL